jgi:hypothetical protein
MIRRALIAWVLVPSLLLSQSVTVVAYTHCAGLTGEHDHRPHFHVPLLNNGASHPNHHYSGRHCQDARLPLLQWDYRHWETSDLFADPHDDHDSNAVYIDRIPVVVQKRGIGTASEDEGPYWGSWVEICWEPAVRPTCFGERIRHNEFPAILSVAIYVTQQRWQL